MKTPRVRRLEWQNYKWPKAFATHWLRLQWTAIRSLLLNNNLFCCYEITQRLQHSLSYRKVKSPSLTFALFPAPETRENKLIKQTTAKEFVTDTPITFEIPPLCTIGTQIIQWKGAVTSHSRCPSNSDTPRLIEKTRNCKLIQYRFFSFLCFDFQ